MATIYQKTSEDKVLMIGPKEALAYPFNVGSWSELRIGIECYATAASGFTFTGENYYTPRSIASENSFFCGIRSVLSGQSGILPFQSGVQFIGFGAGCSRWGYDTINDNWGVWFTCANNITGQNGVNKISSLVIKDMPYTGVKQAIALPGRTNSIAKLIASNQTSFSGLDVFFRGTNNSPSVDYVDSFAPGFKLSNSGALLTQTGNYVSKNALSFSFQNLNKNGQSVLVAHASDILNDGNLMQTPSINDLRNFISTMNISAAYSSLTYNNSSIQPQTQRIFWTSGFSNTGLPLPLPSEFFIYNPFPNLNIGISNLLIEKYA